MLDYLYRIKKKKRVKRYLFVLFLSAEKEPKRLPPDTHKIHASH